MTHPIRFRPAFFAAVVLLGGALASCSDLPTGVAVRAHPVTPALDTYPEPVLSLSYSGGHPLISWSALTDATSYSVEFVVGTNYGNFETAETGSWENASFLGSTTGTSFLDTSRSYTGTAFCSARYGYEWYEWFYRYRVTATFANGTSAQYIGAPVVTC